MRSPFKFLDSYGPEDQELFFGREAETEQLMQMVFQTPLLLLYGMSGAGKTSLVQCGLAGKFAGPDWLPLWIRRRENINDSLQEAIERVWPKSRPMEATLKDQVRLLYRYYLRPVYLIFDQFEELFILSDEGRKEETVFTERLSELLEIDLPCKVILSIREEFIGQLYRMEQQIPTIYDFRLRVEPMGRVRVKEVISKSFKQFSITLERPDQNLDLICDQLSAGKSGIQLPFLQIYLDQLYKDDFRRTYPEDLALPDPLKPLTLETGEIKAFGNIEKVLEQFLLEQQLELEQLLNAGPYGELPPNTVRLMLDAFVTEEGTKRPVPYVQDGDVIHPSTGKVQLFPRIPEEALSQLLQRLIDNRLLRQESERLELSHDSLAALIDRARSDQERQVYQLQSRIVLAEKDFAKTEEHLGPGVLGQIDELWVDLQSRLEAKHLNFIAESRKKQEAALEAERDRLKREEELIRKNRERQRWIWWVIGVAGIIAAGLFIWAFIQSGIAEHNRQEAEHNRQEAEQIRINLERKSEFTQGLKEASNRLLSLAQMDSLPSKETLPDLYMNLPSAFTDLRNQRIYETIELNGQVWMAENLDFDTGDGSRYYGNDPKNRKKYGRLYTWEAARKACPPGWHLPTDEEWREMVKIFGGAFGDAADGGKAAYEALIEGGNSGFSALLGGRRSTDGSFYFPGDYGFYWSATEYGSDSAWFYLFDRCNGELTRSDLIKELRFSCRCVQD